jgi:serine/threonine protein kinase
VKVVRRVKRYAESAEIEARLLRRIHRKDSEDRGGGYCLRLEDEIWALGHKCLVFPLYGPSLFRVIRTGRYSPFSMWQIRRIAHQLFEGLSFLRRIDMIHTDLKPENILLANGGEEMLGVRPWEIRTEDMNIVVVDFGNAIFDHEHHSSVICTRHYRPPEVILKMRWSLPVDMWSVGCILVELFTGDVLFHTHRNGEHMFLIEQIVGPLPRDLTERTERGRRYFRHGRARWGDGDGHEVQKVESLEGILRRAWEKDHTHTRMEEFQGFLSLCRACLRLDDRDRITPQKALAHDFFARPS